ncbi:MAG TPA: hypothetical protein VFU37_06670, partial [Pyrinomonadaceae bacterium]|nr:hypothetical protein [Pyrinomonadaceae bacterium]
LRFRRLDREVFIAFLAGAIRMLSDEQISVKLLGLESPTSVNSCYRKLITRRQISVTDPQSHYRPDLMTKLS